MPYALQVFEDPDHDGRYHWLVLQEYPYNSQKFTPHSASECSVGSYADAAMAGAQALARVEGVADEGDTPSETAEVAALNRVAWPYRTSLLNQPLE